MKFRLLLQPLMSLFLPIEQVKEIQKQEVCLFFGGLISNTGGRKELVKQGWKDVGKVFIMAVVIDIIYQFILI